MRFFSTHRCSILPRSSDLCVIDMKLKTQNKYEQYSNILLNKEEQEKAVLTSLENTLHKYFNYEITINEKEENAKKGLQNICSMMIEDEKTKAFKMREIKLPIKTRFSSQNKKICRNPQQDQTIIKALKLRKTKSVSIFSKKITINLVEQLFYQLLNKIFGKLHQKLVLI